MAEDKKEIEEPTKPTENESSETVAPTEQVGSNIVEEARKVNSERRIILEEEKKLQDRKEKLHAEQMLGGGSQAGQAAKPKAKETDEEYSKRVMRGEL